MFARMRVARVLLFLALSGAVAHADDAKPANPHPADAAPARAKVPLRVVRMLPETKQALLFDRTKGTHVVVEAGQAVEGFYVDSIDDDEVTLLSDNGTTVVLAAPDPAWRHRREAADKADATRPAKTAATAPPTTGPAPAPAPKAGEPQPADPYADLAASPEIGTGADGVRVVEAPDAPAMAPTSAPAPAASSTSSTIGTGADGVRVVEAPNAAAPAPAAVPAPAPAAVSAPAAAPVPAPAAAPVPAPAAAPVPAPAAAPVPAPAAAPVPAPAAGPHDAAGDALAAALTGAPAPTATAPTGTAPTGTAPSATAATATASPGDGRILLARADVKAALASFGTLAGSIRGAFTPAGVRVDSVAAGSLFAKAGLKAGDVVSAVDGVPLKSLDDAADLYARAGSVKAMNVAVVRGGTPIVLRVTIQ